MTCTEYRPDANGECQTCDEPAEAHALLFLNRIADLEREIANNNTLHVQNAVADLKRIEALERDVLRLVARLHGLEELETLVRSWQMARGAFATTADADNDTFTEATERLDAATDALFPVESLMTERFIVAEVSKNWQDGLELHDTGLIAQQFERVINNNAERGYRLVQFSLHRLITGPGAMNETIVAVFEKEAHLRFTAPYTIGPNEKEDQGPEKP